MVFHDGTSETHLAIRGITGKPLYDVNLSVTATCWSLYIPEDGVEGPRGIGWDILERVVDLVIGSTEYQPAYLWNKWVKIFNKNFNEINSEIDIVLAESLHDEIMERLFAGNEIVKPGHYGIGME